MIAIRQAKATDFSLIRKIAFSTWPATYGEILSTEQLRFMLNKFYSLENLKLNVEQNQLFYIISEFEIPLGFLGIEHYFEGNPITKIHKIYVLSNNQGKGIGKLAIDFVIKSALENQNNKIILNVNRFNNAVLFYQKMNFKIVQEIDIVIGNGYLMEDFVMEMSLQNFKFL
jgi:ribosomal protein S18 acetylase RimI-like enzyme